MKSIQTLVGRYAKGKSILILFFVTQAVYLLMLGYTIPQVQEYTDEMEIFDLRPQGYSVGYAQDLLDTLGQDGRDIYLTHQIPVDFVYPGLFIVTYALLLGYIFKHAFTEGNFMQKLVFVPILAGIFDYLENVGIILMLTLYPDFSDGAAQISSLFSISKSVFTTLTFVLLLVSSGKWLFEYIRTRRPSSTLTPSPNQG